MDAQLRTALLDVLRDWGRELEREIGTEGVFVFGSIVYKDGAQFNVATSDIDLVAVFPSNAVRTALLRVKWLENLRERKASLESKLAAILPRDKPGAPIVSLVPATTLELNANVHKDGARGFFSRNRFLGVLDGKLHGGLRYGDQLFLSDDLLMECLRFAQKKRNEFVAVSADGTGGLPSFGIGSDPAPKDVMRCAAMAAALNDDIEEPGVEFDTQKGLDLLSDELYALRSDNLYSNLQVAMSVRRGARGEPKPLSPSDLLRLAELIPDRALKTFEARQQKLPYLGDVHSTIEFSDRFRQAFPGVRKIQWFDQFADFKHRMNILLHEPLIYEDATPIWWFGDGNLPIQKFAEIEPDLFLMNIEELKITRVAAVPGKTYYQNFVYVECGPLEPTGLYKNSKEAAAEATVKGGFFAEEYGLLDTGGMITRAEYDDGAATIAGKPVDVIGRCQLRARYLTPYSFVIAAAQSPINNGSFDNRLRQHLRRILADENRIEDLAADVLKLPKRGW